MNHPEKITVTSPLLPELKEFSPYLENIWSFKKINANRKK